MLFSTHAVSGKLKSSAFRSVVERIISTNFYSLNLLFIGLYVFLLVCLFQNIRNLLSDDLDKFLKKFSTYNKHSHRKFCVYSTMMPLGIVKKSQQSLGLNVVGEYSVYGIGRYVQLFVFRWQNIKQKPCGQFSSAVTQHPYANPVLI